MTERYCVNCEHFRPSWDFDPSQCHRPLSVEVDIVTGRPKRNLFTSARRERKPGKTLFGRVRCGPNASFYQEKPMVAERSKGVRG